MESEKATYWMTLGVLALAATTGFVTDHRGWDDGLAERSITLLSQASAIASNYSGVAGMVLGRADKDLALSRPSVVDIQTNVQMRVACAQRVLARRQAQFDRLQAMRVRVRALERAPRTMVWPNQNIVIAVPPTPEITF
ncbi:MAG: hypothetical protein ACRD20_15465 [Terriglobales bacterium]